MARRRAIPYSADELAFIERHKTLPRREAHALFVETFQRDDVSFVHYNSLCKRKGWLTGRTGCFPKGHIPLNKGRKMPFNPNSARTQFKPGQTPFNQRDIGSERIDRDGYVLMKLPGVNKWLGTQSNWVFKHRYMWEQEHGSIPEKHVLICVDGNKLNVDPSNWRCVHRGVLARLNRHLKFNILEADSRLSMILAAEVDHAAKARRAAS